MKTNTRNDIYKYIQDLSPTTVKNIVDTFSISKQIVHIHLSRLINEDKVYKVGNPPRVYYFPVEEEESREIIHFGNEQKELLDRNFVYFLPNGEVVYGPEGFVRWCEKRSFEPEKEIVHYTKIVEKYNEYKDSKGFIDGTAKMKSTFEDVFLDKVFYLDFYSIEKYGKTLLGNLMLYAKQTNNLELASKVLGLIKENVYELINLYNIDSFAFIPPSIDRKVQLMDQLKEGLDFDLKELKLLKIFKDKPVPQKSLNKKEDRIINASQTIFIGDNDFRGNNILLIDDAVGSGATLNETAKKIRQKGLANNIYGLAIVGSFKGFEVINEV